MMRLRQLGEERYIEQARADLQPLIDPDTVDKRVDNILTAALGKNSDQRQVLTHRERHGYAYTVESAVTLFSDSGLMTVYFGSDERYAKRCLNLVDRTLDSLASSTMRQRALDAAKKQYAGQLLVGSESLEGTALSMGKSVMHFGTVSTVDEITDRIRSVTAEQLRDAAATIAGRYSRLTFL
jgi:predicted Zn-dependent peptidase